MKRYFVFLAFLLGSFVAFGQNSNDFYKGWKEVKNPPEKISKRLKAIEFAYLFQALGYKNISISKNHKEALLILKRNITNDFGNYKEFLKSKLNDLEYINIESKTTEFAFVARNKKGEVLPRQITLTVPTFYLLEYLK
jgi:hypothetical protein